MPDEAILTERQTAGYRPPPPMWSSLFDAQRLPPWNYQWAEAMEVTPQVSFGAAVGHSPLYQSEVEVTCDDKKVAEYISEQWRSMWGRFAKKIVSYDRAGFGALEVVYKWNDETQELSIDGICDFHPGDVKALTESGQLVGARIRSNRMSAGSSIDLVGPKFVWLKYDADYGRLFGRSLLRGAFEPWMEKYKSGGATDLRRLRFIKDSWIGDIGRYPMELVRIAMPDGTIREVSGHDLLQEMLSLRAAGGILMLPSQKDEAGNYIFDYTPPQAVAGATEILSYVESIDWEIWKGQLVPREVVEASTGGSGFSGRTVPMMAFLAIRDVQLMDIVTAFKHVFEFMVHHKYGKKIPFSMRPKPLIEQFAENVGGTQAGGQIGGADDSRPQDTASLFGPSKDGMQFAIGEEPTVAELARNAAMELGWSARNQIAAALKKNSLPTS